MVHVTKNVNGEELSGNIESTLGRLIFNEILPQDLGYVDRSKEENILLPEVDFHVGKKQLKDILQHVINTHGTTTTAEVLDDIKAMGYKYSTRAAMTVSISEMTVPPVKKQLLAEAEKKLDAHYDKNKLRDTFKDKFVLIYSVMCAASVVLLLVLLAYFSPVILTIAILVGLAGSFLLWRRIVDMGKILKEKKRKGKLLLKQALDELTQWRKAYKEADAQSADMLNAIASF